MKEEIFKEVSDDWYPSYVYADEMCVRVSFLPLTKYKDIIGWRVCAWGDDDFGMEKDFEVNEKNIAKTLFEQIKNEKKVLDKKYFQDLGFINA